jgi:hypothetical protein
MSTFLNSFWLLQTALILSIFVISAMIITSIQVWVNKKAGDYSSEIEDYNPLDIMHHVNIIDFILFLMFGFLFIRTAPTNSAYIKSKYHPVIAWSILLTPAFAALGLSFVLYCLSNLFLGTFATDVALNISGMQAPLLEILPKVLPDYSSFSLVLLTVSSISIFYNAIMAVVIAIWDGVRNIIADRYHHSGPDEYSMQLFLTYAISLLLLMVIINPAVSLIFKLFHGFKTLVLALVKVLL